MRRDVFQAIADPTRRQIIGVISKETLTLNGVAAAFDMSRQAVSKHIRILEECGLIVVKPLGRERYYEPRLEKLNEIEEWVAQYRQYWASHLDSMENYLNEIQKKAKSKQHGTRKKQ